MKRFKNILLVVPRDGDVTEPMRAAEQLAVANGARITLFDVLSPFRSGRNVPMGGYSPEQIRLALEEGRKSELEALAGSIDVVDVTTAVATGRPFLEIIRRVRSSEHDVVIIAPDQPGGLIGLARASTTIHLLRKCPVPVWAYRPEVPPGGDILAAVGPFEEGIPSSLDRKLVELGSSLAERQGARFHIVHAWSLEGESMLRSGRIGMSAGDVDRLVLSEERDAQDALGKLIAEAGLDPASVEIHLVNNRPVSAIGDVAEKIDPSVVVMGTLARSGVAGLLIGNTAETTLGSLRSSIIAVKPDGFVSPIESAL
jgi:nucleotide-binding universal stress UspA family protein